MPTRRQLDAAFSSSSEYEQGVLANLVANRCSALSDKEEITLIWWLQQVSWRQGGLDRFIPSLGEMGYFSEQHLRKALIDPECGYPRIIGPLREKLLQLRAKEIAAARSRIVETATTRQINEELDFAFESRSFVLIEGREGIGKSEAARSWADQHPGEAVYVALESGADETTLYRSIARKIGTACSYQRMAGEMKMRIQDALQGGNLLLILDEAHFLWPQAARSERVVPKRMDWVRTALVDCGVPVALVSTPQFFARQCERFRKAGWNSNQVERRLVRTAMLADSLSAAEALAVGRSYFPDASTRLLKLAAAAALLSVSRLTMFSHLRKRVDFLSSRRPTLSRDELLEAALAEIEAPGLNASKADAEALQGSRTVRAQPVLSAPDRVSSSTPKLDLTTV